MNEGFRISAINRKCVSSIQHLGQCNQCLVSYGRAKMLGISVFS